MINENVIEIGDSVKRVDLKEGGEEYDKELEITEISEGKYYHYKIVNGIDVGHNNLIHSFRLIKKKNKNICEKCGNKLS